MLPRQPYVWRMTKEQIEAVLGRFRSWPIERQEEAALMLLAFEEEAGRPYELSDGELKDIQQGIAEEERGEIATDAEVDALRRRWR